MKIKMCKNKMLTILALPLINILLGCSGGGGGGGSSSKTTNNDYQNNLNPSSSVTNSGENGGNTRSTFGILVGSASEGSTQTGDNLTISAGCNIKLDLTLPMAIMQKSVSFYDNSTGAVLQTGLPQIAATPSKCGESNPIYSVEGTSSRYVLISFNAFGALQLSQNQAAKSAITAQYLLLEQTLKK